MNAFTLAEPAALHTPDGDGAAIAGPPFDWRNRFATLGAGFYTRLAAEPLPAPHWVARSDDCAALLGLPDDWWQRGDWRAVDVLSGNAHWSGMAPLASVYSGHQFGVWAGQLGDGRALWLGEVEAPAGGQELQLKGSGRTPYSRMGDGRAVLRSSIREFLCSEAMHGLGIPTTRALAVVGSPLPVRRETIETAAVLTRVAPSFIRFGHFEHFASRSETERLRRLADFVIEQHYPECVDQPNRYAALLEAVARRTALLIAQWQAVGFCHGVMNTDNLSILGLTIDYGPFGFLDAFDPGHICNHSDTQGRYAYARQPQVAQWNLHALAHALLPLLTEENERPEAASDLALAALKVYPVSLAQALEQHFNAKLGFATGDDGDRELAEALLARMAADRTDFTIAFRRLAAFNSGAGATNDPLRDLFIDREAFDAWAQRYGERLRHEGSVDAERAARMRLVNPLIVLRNHLAENAIQQAASGEFDEIDRLLKVLRRPYDEAIEPGDARDAYAAFPPDWAQTIEVSCSS